MDKLHCRMWSLVVSYMPSRMALILVWFSHIRHKEKVFSKGGVLKEEMAAKRGTATHSVCFSKPAVVLPLTLAMNLGMGYRPGLQSGCAGSCRLFTALKIYLHVPLHVENQPI